MKKESGMNEYLLSVIADIRLKTGVGAKPMLSELADAIVEKINKAKQSCLDDNHMKAGWNL